MSEHEADAYLLDGVRLGRADAWREVISRYEGRLVSFARRMLADRAEAEDLVQETFLGLLRSLANYDRSRSLETYLFAILRNKLHDYFRKTGRGQRQSLDSIEPDEAPAAWISGESPSRHVEGRENVAAQRAALVHAVRMWIANCREQGRFQELIVIEMLVVHGLRNKEVAADLGLSETAVAGIKFRVLEQWGKLTNNTPHAHEWTDADLAGDSTVAGIWREEALSCLKRSTLGKYLLGVLEDDWNLYIDFHVNQAGCDRCQANLEDLRSEERLDAKWQQNFRERCFASSVGFLSRSESV